MIKRLRTFFYRLFYREPRHITFENEYEIVYLLRQIETHLSNIEVNTRQKTRGLS